MPSQKIKTQEYDDYMIVEIPWFSSSAVFLLVFTVIWNALIFFFYNSMITSGVPFVFLLIPIVHLIVGLFLIYQTTSWLFNTSKIELDKDLLTVKHGPIPQFKKNVEIPVEQIAQIYVEKKTKQGENTVSHQYNLMAKLRSGIHRPVMNVGILESHEAIALEEKLENFLEIRDQNVKGEHGKRRSRVIRKADKDTFGKRPRQLDTSQLDWLDATVGSEIFFKNVPMDVGHRIQYDWKNGESDQQIQLIEDVENHTLLFINQEKALYKTFEEKKINLKDAYSIDFNRKKPAKKFTFKKTEYYLVDFKEGVSFIDGKGKAIATKHWIYQTETEESQIRIINQENIVSYYQGKKVTPRDFEVHPPEDNLDLNQPRKQPRIDYDENDLV